jgi:hypothetical protein
MLKLKKRLGEGWFPPFFFVYLGMVKKTNKSTDETSFHGITIKTTLGRLRAAFGDPQWESNDGEDKTNIDYNLETPDGDVFTVYDWKNYRPIGEDEVLDFHIGADSSRIAFQAKNEMHKMGLFVG